MAYLSSSSNAQQRAISHQTWSRKKAPISRVGSYDFNGSVDRATMKMHINAADRSQEHANVLTLWPLASTAIDKNECFAVREREVLWTMRPGKGIGRISDGRLRALSSLNYFRLVLSDTQLKELRQAMKLDSSKSNAHIIKVLRALVGHKRMEDTEAKSMTLDTLNKVDALLRSYVLSVIQYAGVAITGEEAGSRQHLQGIAVTVGGLNTLANNGDKTLCPGMRLCMTVPRCVPDSSQWPAPCDHIGLPHGKVVPILRHEESVDMHQTIVNTHVNRIHQHVAQLMSGCCNGTSTASLEKKDVPQDAYFAFVKQDKLQEAFLKTVGKEHLKDKIVDAQLDVMRRINDAVVFTVSTNKKNNFDVGNTTRCDSEVYDRTKHYSTPLEFDATNGILQHNFTHYSRILVIVFGNVRNIVLAEMDDTTVEFDDIKNLSNFSVPNALRNNIGIENNKNDPDATQYAAMIVQTTQEYCKKCAPKILVNGNETMYAHTVVYNEMQAVANGNASFALGYHADPSTRDEHALGADSAAAAARDSNSGSEPAGTANSGSDDTTVQISVGDMSKEDKTMYQVIEEGIETTSAELEKAQDEQKTAKDADTKTILAETIAEFEGILKDMREKKAAIESRYAQSSSAASSVSNTAEAQVPSSAPNSGSNSTNLKSHYFQPNVVVLDDTTLYPWDTPDIEQITKTADKHHSTCTLVFRKKFQAPFKRDKENDNEYIEVSDNEVPFVGAWLVMPKSTAERLFTDKTAYRSVFAPQRFLVHQTEEVNYYYLTWSAVVHTLSHNVLHRINGGKRVLEMQRAQLVVSPHYDYVDGSKSLSPGLNSTTADRYFGAPGLGSYLRAILMPDTGKNTQYQDYLRKHSPIASLVSSVITATVEAVVSHQLTTEKKTVGMALSSASRGEAVDVVLTGAV